MSADSRPTDAAAGVAFDGAVALVTGAGRGLGAAIARRLADIDTRLLRAGFDRGVIDEEYVVGRIPAAQLGSAAQVGSVVTFLASSAAAYVTGQALAVDGGFTVNGAPHPIAAQPDRAEVL